MNNTMEVDKCNDDKCNDDRCNDDMCNDDTCNDDKDDMSTTDLMDEFEEAITAFMEIEQIHTEILTRLERLSLDCNGCDIDVLKKMHQDAMDHIRATGTSNFGQALLRDK